MSRKSIQRKRGDRRDGKWLKDLDGMHLIMPFLFPKRTESEVYLLEQVDASNLVKYVEKKNLENPDKKTTAFHVFVAAIGKTLHFRPYLNRFIAGGRVYQRFEETVAFMVKRKFEDHADEIIMVLKIRPDMTLDDISRKIRGDTEKVRSEKNGSDIDKMMETVGRWPRFFNRFFFWLVRTADYYGLMPESVMKGDPDFSSVLVSNLGSIKCGAPYHHLNNYGTNSVMITIGEIHKAPIVNEKGEVEVRDVVDLGCTLDERIADGFYFARSVKYIKYLIENPELLELPVESETDYEFK